MTARVETRLVTLVSAQDRISLMGKGPDEGAGVGFPSPSAGHVAQDTGVPVVVVQVRTNAEQDRKVQEYVDQNLDGTDAYCLINNSCVDFVRDALRTGRVRLPPGAHIPNTPGGLIDMLTGDGHIKHSPAAVIPQ